MINKRLKDALFTDQWSELFMETLGPFGYVLVSQSAVERRGAMTGDMSPCDEQCFSAGLLLFLRLTVSLFHGLFLGGVSAHAGGSTAGLLQVLTPAVPTRRADGENAHGTRRLLGTHIYVYLYISLAFSLSLSLSISISLSLSLSHTHIYIYIYISNKPKEAVVYSDFRTARGRC